MTDYGFQSWGASGVPNNYGIKPVSVLTYIALSNGQKSGAWSFNIPTGFKLNYYHINNDTSNSGALGNGRRRISVSGGALTISAAGDYEYSAETYPASQAFLVITVETS